MTQMTVPTVKMVCTNLGWVACTMPAGITGLLSRKGDWGRLGRLRTNQR